MANRRFIDFPIASTVGNNDIILIWQSGMNKQTTKATLLNGLPENLEDLLDVNITGLTNGQILRYDSVTGKWENTDQGNLDLDDLNDVTIVSPTNGQVLVYNSSTSKWENSSAGFVPYTGAVSTVNLGAQTIQAGSFVKAGGTSSQFLKADGSVDSTAYGTGSVTSVGLTMPSAFNVANSPVTTSGTLAVTGAGTVGQYIRGDGSLADFPSSTGGGSSVSYYLNGSVSQGTIGGVAYKELNKVPILGTGTDFTINADGYIAQFLTDAGDPNLLEIPGGNWNFETYFSASSGGGSPTFYVELYKYDGSTFTLIASNSGNPELIAFGTNVTSYFSTLAVPTTVLTLTDRLAIRYYVTHSGRTITLHTENNHLCQVITTFTTGLTALNGLTAQVQYFAVGTSGTDFNIASATATHTFNLPTASATNRGALSSSDWTTFNNKQNALTNPVTGTGTTNYLPKFTGTSSIGNSIVQDAGIRVDIGGDIRLTPSSSVNIQAYTGSVYTNLFYNAASHNWQNSGGATKMFLNSNDNLLIGTTTDGGQKLQVTGTFALRASASISSATQIPIFNADPSGTTRELVTRTPAQLLSDIGGQAALTNPVTGTGTTNYLPKFTGSTTIGNSIVQDTGTRIDIAGVLRLTPSSQVDIQAYTGSAYSNLFYDAASHNWQTSGGTAKMTLAANGNLLIGTTTDNGAKLQVSGAVSTSSKYAWGTAINGTTGQIATDNTHNYFDYLGNLYFRGAAASNTLITFTNTGAATFSSSVTANGTIRITRPADTSQYIDIYPSGGEGFIDAVNSLAGTSQALIFRNGNSGGITERMRITSGGDIIGYNNFRSTVGFNLYKGSVTRGGMYDYSSISGSGTDYSTTIFSETGQGIYFAGNGSATRQMTLTSSGNLLVGTTSDNGARLQVSGAIYASDELYLDNGKYLRFRRSSGNLSIQTLGIPSGTDDVRLLTTGDFNVLNGSLTNLMTVKNSGNVGIGTSSPQAYTNFTTLSVDNPTNGGVVSVRYNGTAYLNLYTAFGEGRVEGANGSFLTFRTTDTERMRITSGGNVGIGTSSPSNILHLFKSTYPILTIQSTSYQSSLGIDTASGLLVLNNESNAALGFNTNATERMRITSGGNVLIGTTTDGGQRLQVSGTSKFNNNMDIGTSSTNNILMYCAGSNNPSVGVYGGAGSNSANGAASLNVVDFTNNKYWQIQIDGSSQLATFYYNGSVWSKVGYQTTGGTWTNSDKRRKENIEISKYGLNEILQLKPKKFNYKLDERKIKNLGFIAQDVIDLIPESVQTDIDGQEEYYAMNYSNLVPVLVKAIQELKQEIDTLKN